MTPEPFLGATDRTPVRHHILSVLVENKAGARGQVMLTDVKNNAKPDRYTLAIFVSPGSVTIPLDPARKAAFSMSNFQWIANHGDDPGAVLVRAESPFKTLEGDAPGGQDPSGTAEHHHDRHRQR